MACQDDREVETVSSVNQALTVTRSFQNGNNGYSGMTDAHIRQGAADANEGSATTCDVDGSDTNGLDRSCLMRWDVTAIPPGSLVQSVTMTLRATNGSANTYSIYAITRPWIEDTVTWNRADATVTWQSPGAFGPNERGAVIGSVTGSGTINVSLNAAGIALVQSWIDGGTNGGIIIASATNSDGLAFASSEHSRTAYRPKLTVTYAEGSTVPSGTGGAATGGAATGGAATGGAATGGAATGGAATGGAATGGAATGGAASAPSAIPEPNLLVAFLGDQGANSNADGVLNLVKNEGAAAVVHNGDFDYMDSPSTWNARIDGILGPNFPYFAVVGNHDAAAWDGANGYASYINARLSRVPAMQCAGDVGVKATCRFRGLYMVQSCVGTSELTGHGNCGKDSTEQVAFIRNALSNDSSLWSLCLWHKNQNDMQIGTKTDEVGWNAYKECMNGGAIITTAHEHSYSRTVGLTDLGNGAVGHGAVGSYDSLIVSPGRTFVVVSGLGGNSVRDYDSATHADDTWWASQYAAKRWMKSGQVQSGSGTYGALFIRFRVDGNPRLARGYFKDVNGRLVDEFTIQVP
jgi:hypothetical protein